MKITNWLSLFRIAVLPVVAVLIYQETALAFLWSIILLIAAVISDFLDGYLARRLNEKTVVGSFLDPFADKILMAGLLLIFVFREDFPFWILAFFIFRDIFVFIIRWLASHYNLHIYEQWHSSLMTTSQVGIVLFILISEFFVYKGLTEDMFYVISDLMIVLITIIAISLSAISIIYYLTSFLNKKKQVQKMGNEVDNGKIVILANKKARGYQNKYRRRLLKIFAKRRKAKIIYLPHNQKNMFKGIEKKLKGYQHVIIAGGDGSFEGACNYKPLHKKHLGFFPLGAGNAYYSYFYRGNRFEYLRSRFDFREMDLDMLEVKSDLGTFYTTFFSLGIDAEVIRLANNRTKNGFRDYIRAAWKAWWSSRANYDLKCKVDNKVYTLDNCTSVNAGKIPYYGFSVRALLGDVIPNDGKVYGLAVVNTHNSYSNKIARFLALILTAINLHKHPVLNLRGKSIKIEGDVPFAVQVGGEFVGFTSKVNLRVGRKQKVLVI
jgi:CDP-diacylglycerol---glycerol-3-phosphate 3-phosphatidyltransferase